MKTNNTMPYVALNNKVRSVKKRLIKEIMKVVIPLMWKSGYAKGDLIDRNRENLRLLYFKERRIKDKEGDWVMSPEYRITDVLSIAGFTEECCIITDAYGGGLLTQNMDSIDFESLLKIYTFVKFDRYNVISKFKTHENE